LDEGGVICSRCEPNGDFTASLCQRCSKPHNPSRAGAKRQTMCNPCIDEYTLIVGKAVNLKRKRIEADPPIKAKQARTGNGLQETHPVSV
jgi:hypothetical protein